MENFKIKLTLSKLMSKIIKINKKNYKRKFKILKINIIIKLPIYKLNFKSL